MEAAAKVKIGQVDGEAFPQDIQALREALIRQRQYTLSLYADLPSPYWVPARCPFLPIVNPPLWELGHIAWFAEFFCLRWRSDDVLGINTPSISPVADGLFNSQTVPHPARWCNIYPERDACLEYMQLSLDAVLDSLDTSDPSDRYRFQLAVGHEDMHAEALAMTLVTLGQPLPRCVPTRVPIAADCQDISFQGGAMELGASTRVFQFDNELPVFHQEVPPFSIASRSVTATEFMAFVHSREYFDDRLWSAEGREWRESVPVRRADMPTEFPAIHVNYFEADAWCRWTGRRLPTESEWEFAATHSTDFWDSTGGIWEWCASAFVPHPGFEPHRYRDYSLPWFYTHQVLKGGSFVSSRRLRYPQYRNFYMKERSDMFCGFRTCAVM
ncbi:MAG: SUMF1/EgtB/PvdO family nonheme iron enzyme [Betaproteobacteria bacterium]